MISATNLRTTIADGDVGAIDDFNDVHEAINELTLVHTNRLNVKAFGAKGDGVTDDTAAFAAAIAAAAALVKPGLKLQSSGGVFQGGGAANGGASIEVPPGVYVVSNVVLRHRVSLELDSGAILFQKAASTGPVVTNRRDNVEHAQYCGVVGGTIHGNKANQTSANPGILWQGDESNNYNSPLDEDYDVNCYATNVYVMLTKGDGIRLTGAGANRITDCKVRGADGNGIYAFQDNHISGCDVGWSGLAGVRVSGESTTVTNTKSWYSGRVTVSAGHGFYMDADSGAISGCNAQDNKASGFCWDNAFGWSASALLSDSNSRDNSGTYAAFDVFASGFVQVQGVARNRYRSNSAVGEQASALSFTNSASCVVDVVAATGVWGQSPTYLKAGSTTTGNNTIRINGELIAGAAATKASVGLGNVDNTADSAKPVSTAQAAAIAAWAPVIFDGTAWPTSRPTPWGANPGILSSTKYAGAPTPPSWTIDGDEWRHHPADAG